MPNRAEHERVGALVGALAALVQAHGQLNNHSGAEVIGGMIGGWFGGIAPDLLEPPTSPNHREFAHSLVVGGTLTLSKIAELQAACRSRAALSDYHAANFLCGSRERAQVELNALLWRVLAGALVGFAAGYVSHLALDGATKRGIPFIGAG